MNQTDKQALSWIEQLLTIDTPTLSNAIELLKIRPQQEGFTPLNVRALFPEFGRMCGYAVTAQVETMTKTSEFDIGRFIELWRAIDAAPKPAIVVLQEIGGHPDYAAHCGEVMTTFMMRLGAIGLVSDSAVRDIPEVRALGFHYFARGAVASHANFTIVRTGAPVQIHGMVVKSGDLLHGDVNGLLSVPAGHDSQLIDAVERVRTRERKLMDFIRSDQFSIDGIRDFQVD